jgi:hypothetical protein
VDVLSPSRVTALPGAQLFERIPGKLFSALSTQNRERIWHLICHLHYTRFGPEAPIPPAQGYPLRTITLDLENEIEEMSFWDAEEGLDADCAVQVRAQKIMGRLRDCGWLKMDRIGLRDMITMPRDVVLLLNSLIEFAESRPILVGGKVKLIRHSLDRVLEDPTQGDLLHETADQARSLLEHIRSTGTDVHNLTGQLEKIEQIGAFAQYFVEQIVEGKFIADYRTLRTSDHPLLERAAIVRIAEELGSQARYRDPLRVFYLTNLSGNNEARAERMLARDIGRLLDLSRVDEYLEHLDSAISRANLRAHATLHYKLNYSRNFSPLLVRAVEVVQNLREGPGPEILPAGELMGPARLAPPNRRAKQRTPASIQSRALSEAQRERMALMRMLSARRQFSQPELMQFVAKQLTDRDSIDSDDMTLEGQKEIRIFQELQILAMLLNSGQRRLMLKAREQARGFDLDYFADEDDRSHPYVTGRRFVLKRRK